MVYVDTSVLAAYYCPEPLSNKAEEIIRSIKRPAISRLTEVELVSAVSRKIRENELSSADGNKIIGHFHSHIQKAMFKRLMIEDQHYQTAIHWISQFSTPLRTLDALHLAIVAANKFSLLTADIQLSNSARNFGIEVSIIT